MMPNTVGDNTHIELDSTNFEINNITDDTSCTDNTNDCKPVTTEINTKQVLLKNESVHSKDSLSPVNAAITFQSVDTLCLMLNNNGSSENDNNVINQLDNTNSNTFPEKTNSIILENDLFTGKNIDVEDNMALDQILNSVDQTGLKKYEYLCVDNSFNDLELGDIIIPETSAVNPTLISNLIEYTPVPKDVDSQNRVNCSDIDDLLNKDLEQILNLKANTANNCSHPDESKDVSTKTATEKYCTTSLSSLKNNLEPNYSHLVNLDFVQASNLEKVIEVNLGSVQASNLDKVIEVNLGSVQASNLDKVMEVNLDYVQASNLDKVMEVNLGSEQASNLDKVIEVNLDSVQPSNLDKVIEVNLGSVQASNLDKVIEVIFESAQVSNLDKVIDVNFDFAQVSNLDKAIEVNLDSVQASNLDKAIEPNFDFAQVSNLDKVIAVNCTNIKLKYDLCLQSNGIEVNDTTANIRENISSYKNNLELISSDSVNLKLDQGSSLRNDVNCERNSMIENHNTTAESKDEISLSTMNVATELMGNQSFNVEYTIRSNIENNTEINSSNNESRTNVCTQGNVGVKNDCSTTKYEDNISSFTSYNDIESEENQSIKIETMDCKNSVKMNENDHSNESVGIDCVDFTIPVKAEEMNKDQNPLEAILADFHSNKAKAASYNLMPINNGKNSTQIEPKFPRPHREIITPDFGNIVKNVHGIFSSVSGSLMNAYNISHKPNANYNILKYGTYAKKEEKCTNDVSGKIIDSSKQSIKVLENRNESNMESSAKPEDSIPKSAISSKEFDVGPLELNSTTVLDEKSEPNSPINNGIPPQQNSMDSNETVTQSSDEGNNNIEVYRLQVQTLETSLAEQRKEVSSLRDRVKQQSDELINKDHICKDMETKMDLMRKRVERAERDADASVMRYATSERAVLEARSAADNAKKAEKQAVAEAELLNAKLRSAHAEKARICQLLDNKIHELTQSEREVNKLREDARATDTKLKWTQNKLRTEMDAYKDSTAQVEKLTEQLTDLQSRVENTQANVQDSIRAKELESQLHQCQASLILERHERERCEAKLRQVSSQAEVSGAEVQRNIRELEELRSQVKKLSANNLELEEEAAELATLRAKAALSDTLATQLQSERARAFAAEESRAAAEAKGAAAAHREGAALEHAAKVTAEHVASQARAHQHEAKASALAADNVSLRDRLSFLESEVTRLQTELSSEASRRRQQTEALSTRVTELEQEVEDARRKLEWEVGEKAVLKKKQASATKELNRELQRSLKRCQYLESRHSTVEEKNELSKKRTGSISSINSLETNTNLQSSSDEGRVNGHPTPLTEEPNPEYQSEGPSRQMLIERVVDLQRAAARRAERCDFLEEHTRALTAELRNKTRLVRHLAAAQPSGALDTPQRDQHKSEVARKGGGAMAAVYGGESNGMSLELSLEMNKKLQAVLEDALLKNITLRENMDTLGAEIARLKSAQQEATNGKSLQSA